MRTAEPRETLFANERLAELLARLTTVDSSPNWMLPPMLIPAPYFVSSIILVALDATVPPFNVSRLEAAPPMALTPRRIIVPAFSVKPPLYVFPASAKTPVPFFMNPVPEVVENDCVEKSITPPAPTSMVLTAPFVARVFAAALKFTVTPLATVMFPTLIVAPIPAKL